jgi:hypothetical protein
MLEKTRNIRTFRKINGPTQALRGSSAEIELIKKNLSERELQFQQAAGSRQQAADSRQQAASSL